MIKWVRKNQQQKNKGRSFVLTFGFVYSSVSPFLPVFPFFIQLIHQILLQEFGTDCLGLVQFYLKNVEDKKATTNQMMV